jgi:hypothetical protein
MCGLIFNVKRWVMGALGGLGGLAMAATPIPEPLQRTLSTYCLDCHDASERKGNVNLDQMAVDWTDPSQQDLWARALDSLERGLMPPPRKKQPAVSERDSLAAYLEQSLLRHVTRGSSAPKRLNQAEYKATLRALFHLPEFALPPGFPGDGESHGFDTVSEGLLLSPAHAEAYQNVALELADRIFPPRRPEAEKMVWNAGPGDMVLSFAAATVHGEALRLVSKSETAFRSCTWPSRLEVRDSGTYRIAVDASQFRTSAGRPFEGPMVLEVRARDLTASDRTNVNQFRLLKEMEVGGEARERFEFEADLFEGETVLLRWANAEMTHDAPGLRDLYREWFQRDRRFLAAWQKAIFPAGDLRAQLTRLRGRHGWETVAKLWEDPELDLRQATMEAKQTVQILEIANSFHGTTSIADALCHFYHERGPALQFHGLRVEGPLRRVEGPEDRLRLRMRAGLLGERKPGQSQEAWVEEILKRLLPRAFRGPVGADTVRDYGALVEGHCREGHSFEEAMHLVLRTVLTSPRFLYHRGADGSGADCAIANRLSYFLTQGPPDERLVRLAEEGGLSRGPQLRKEALRLLPSRSEAPFIQSFVGQWLGTRRLANIMPDPRFRFDESRVRTARHETERFFTEILNRNLPMSDFIDPDFTYSTPEFLQRIYGIAAPRPGSKSPGTVERLPIPRGGRYGGLLGQSAILMATANGVDTQPVVRGVWVLENILGTPPPPPPKNVPALTPDTRGSTSPRALLAAHTRDAACAGCHQRIDPIGLVLEHYDPVGQWRTRWPKTEIPIDASCVLPDGTQIQDPVEFKAWLVGHIDQFSQCVGEKLLTYATGRPLNFAEKREVRAIVRRNHARGNGFKDLLLDLIESETFRSP